MLERPGLRCAHDMTNATQIAQFARTLRQSARALAWVYQILQPWKGHTIRVHAAEYKMKSSRAQFYV